MNDTTTTLGPVFNFDNTVENTCPPCYPAIRPTPPPPDLPIPTTIPFSNIPMDLNDSVETFPLTQTIIVTTNIPSTPTSPPTTSTTVLTSTENKTLDDCSGCNSLNF